MEEWGTEIFSFNFTPAVITELGPDPEWNRTRFDLFDDRG